MHADLALRVGQDTSYVPAELDVTGVADLRRPGVGRQFVRAVEAPPLRGLDRCH
jgi:hypothetical protein